MLMEATAAEEADLAADLMLQQKEEEIRKMQDMLVQMQHQLQVDILFF